MRKIDREAARSATETPLTGLRGGKIVWRTSESGVAWSPVPQAEPPASTAAARGVQMRAIARKFSATKTEPNKVVHQLRLMPRPVWVFKPSGLGQEETGVSYDEKEVQRFPFVPFRDRDDPLQPYTKFFNQLYQDLP